MPELAYPAIKAADFSATVLMGGLAYDGFIEYGGSFSRYFPADVMEAGGAQYLAALNVHYFPDFHAEWERWVPEGNPPRCDIVGDGAGTPNEARGIDVIAKLNHFRNRLSVCPPNVDKPIWVTELAEHGHAGDLGSLWQQARYVIQGHARGPAAGVENISWFALITHDEWEQGLLFDDGTPKPAFYAYRSLASELAGHEYARTLHEQSVEGYVFQNPCRQEKTVAWGGGTLTFAPAGQVRVVDGEGTVTVVADGSTEDMDGVQNGAVTLHMTADPVLVSR